ncbi:HAD family hydrolase [Planctomicrobium piriforme]|uniref:Haloacid dehalogenase superfamily, subfamily IA, variant 3 with third motif having DD or ED n=1 Tax=Planctomicrobium piriforme TaxID=1576369 RepID=A0A1I3GNV1_9PLAN|nr:HAD family phosphatase [Planctomicrobium piriforme]SFI25106.1 haloacid dehalogenase superfamily, subfamily IA, variant 3 with third motif having DD or ED [Planctomicrobium piriforme]
MNASQSQPASERPVIRAVAFDLDGLMFNTEDVFHLTGTELLRRRGKVATPALFHAMMGRRSREAFQAMIELMELNDSIDDLAVESGDIFDALLEQHLSPMPGLFDLLDLLDANQIPRAVATSSGRAYLTAMLNRYQLLPRFDFLLSAEDVLHGKPNPEIYQTAARRLGVPPEQMLVMEDSENGVKAAVGSGAYAVAIPHDHSRHHDFRGVKAVAHSLADPCITGLFAHAH